MAAEQPSQSAVYQYPHYYALGYRWNTKTECDFLERCLAQYAGTKGKRVLDIGCGAGRHMLELAGRGYQATGFDLGREMVDYVNTEAKRAGLRAQAIIGDMHEVPVQGRFDLAVCLMDTFRFLLSNEAITRHLQQVAQRLVDGGLYVTDFWIPVQWDKIANEIYQWEQAEGDTTVRVFYLQHPESIDPIQQTFEDELVFTVEEGGDTREIRGGRTRTRLILPQEFRALVETSGAFDVAATFGSFEADAPLNPSTLSWRMITVLKKRAGPGQARPSAGAGAS